MSTTGSGLKDLHLLHVRLKDVTQKLQRGPTQVKARQQFTAKKSAELDEKKGALTDLKKLADEKSLQMKTNESKIAELKVKLNSASSNREFDIIRDQIDADTMANSVLEDEILETLEKVDEVQVEFGQLEQELNEARAQEGRLAEDIKSSEPGLRDEISRVEAEITEAESILPSVVFGQYQRLVQAHGAGAMAAVENNACTACYLELSPQSRVELNSGKIVFCKSCGRLLYRNED